MQLKFYLRINLSLNLSIIVLLENKLCKLFRKLKKKIKTMMTAETELKMFRVLIEKN